MIAPAIEGDHPYFFIKSALLGSDRPLVLEFSRYIYEPRSIRDIRETFVLNYEDFTEEWVNYQLSILPKDMELAFHSRLSVGDKEYHIPLVDFGKQPPVGKADMILEHRLDGVSIAFKLFDSGRSKHGYSDILLSRNEWVALMGKLLLLNVPDYPEVIDSRWIGHRLLAGYSSLRWSANTQQYQHMPRLVA